MEAPSVAQCAFKMCRGLLSAHSRYGGRCSVLSLGGKKTVIPDVILNILFKGT
jgi:hypothetical protein